MMSNSNCANLLRRRQVRVAFLLSLFCISTYAFGACFVEFERSCGALWTNSTRVCVGIGGAQPCGDVIVTDQDVTDVIAAPPGIAGRKGFSTNLQICGSVTSMIQFMKCDDLHRCVFDGSPVEKVCNNRCIIGDACVGASAS